MRSTITALLIVATLLVGCQNTAEHKVEMTTPDYGEYELGQPKEQTIAGRPDEFGKPRLDSVRAEQPPTEGQDAAALKASSQDAPPVPLGETTAPRERTLSDLSRPTPETTSVVAPPNARPYTVAKGDNYWNIATRMLGDGQRWREIRDLNPGVDPTKLRIGQVIFIPEN